MRTPTHEGDKPQSSGTPVASRTLAEEPEAKPAPSVTPAAIGCHPWPRLTPTAPLPPSTCASPSQTLSMACWVPVFAEGPRTEPRSPDGTQDLADIVYLRQWLPPWLTEPDLGDPESALLS